jgi:hypothetical protein
VNSKGGQIDTKEAKIAIKGVPASALALLDAWRAQYIKIARVALRGEPQLLEKIGVAARTSKTSAQRAARKKKVAA